MKTRALLKTLGFQEDWGFAPLIQRWDGRCARLGVVLL